MFFNIEPEAGYILSPKKLIYQVYSCHSNCNIEDGRRLNRESLIHFILISLWKHIDQFNHQIFISICFLLTLHSKSLKLWLIPMTYL